MTDTITPVSVATTPAPPALPEQFADLAPFTDWIFDTWRPRYEKRLASTMDEMQAFYDAAFPRAEAAIEYLDQFALDELPDDALNLMRVLYSLISISFAVEAWRQPNVPDSGAAYLDLVLEPKP
jgi:hypothetical protein